MQGNLRSGSSKQTASLTGPYLFPKELLPLCCEGWPEAKAIIAEIKNPNQVTHPNIGSSILADNENVHTVSLGL